MKVTEKKEGLTNEKIKKPTRAKCYHLSLLSQKLCYQPTSFSVSFPISNDSINDNTEIIEIDNDDNVVLNQNDLSTIITDRLPTEMIPQESKIRNNNTQNHNSTSFNEKDIEREILKRKCIKQSNQS